MKSRKRNRSRWAHVNTPAGLRNRNAKAEAKRDEWRYGLADDAARSGSG